MTIETGALEQMYAKEEVTYRTPPVLAATDGNRHLELSVTSKKNREPSPEKRGTPDESQSLPRRQTSAFDLSSIMWEPSGTLGVNSDVGKFFEGGMGAKTTPNKNTTVAAMPAPTTTSATLISGAGLAVGDIIIVTVGAGARREATRIKTIATNDITFDLLSAAPDVPGAVVSGVNYKLANNITKSYSIFKYYNAGNFKQAVYGSVVNRIQASFDGTKEVMLAISGPSGEYADSTVGVVQAKPGSHTTVGSPASGLVGNFYVDGVAFLVIAAQVTVDNAIELRNKELGTSLASGIAGRANLRKVNLSVTFYLEDTNLLGKANAVTHAVLRCVVGQTNGSMVAFVCPNVEFEIPDVGNEIGPKELTIEGVAYAVNGNDQVVFNES